jgi:hypothetical protein
MPPFLSILILAVATDFMEVTTLAHIGLNSLQLPHMPVLEMRVIVLNVRSRVRDSDRVCDRFGVTNITTSSSMGLDYS